MCSVKAIENRKGATRKGYIFRLQVHEREENSLVEVKRELAHYLLLKYMSGQGNLRLPSVKGPKTEDVFYGYEKDKCLF